MKYEWGVILLQPKADYSLKFIITVVVNCPNDQWKFLGQSCSKSLPTVPTAGSELISHVE